MPAETVDCVNLALQRGSLCTGDSLSTGDCMEMGDNFTALHLIPGLIHNRKMRVLKQALVVITGSPDSKRSLIRGQKVP